MRRNGRELSGVDLKQAACQPFAEFSLGKKTYRKAVQLDGPLEVARNIGFRAKGRELSHAVPVEILHIFNNC